MDEANQQLASMSAALEALSSGAEDEECRRVFGRGLDILKATAVKADQSGMLEAVEALESLVVNLGQPPGPASGMLLSEMRERLGVLSKLVRDVGAPA